jgi:hypothetical protein
MGRIHFIRSGGLSTTGKTLLASMLFEYLRDCRIPCHYIDTQDAPAANQWPNQICFDPQEPTRADRLVELAINTEVIIDLSVHAEQEANRWIAGISDLVQKKDLQMADWFVHNSSRASWRAFLRQTAFWQRLEAEVPKIFLFNQHFPIGQGYLPNNTRQIFGDQRVTPLIFPALGLPLDDRTIGQIISESCHPQRKALLAWRSKVNDLFQTSRMFSPPVSIPQAVNSTRLQDLFQFMDGDWANRPPSGDRGNQDDQTTDPGSIEDCPL